MKLGSSIAIALCLLFRLSIAVDSVVDLTCNIYAGVPSADGITRWLGLRYAASPVGELRFMPPEDPPCNSTVQTADTHGPYCLGINDPGNSAASEDCLFLDVYAPSNITAFGKLPVYFFIQGGGFGTNANPDYDGGGLITASGYSIIVVTFNYRVGPYGFITDGSSITPNIGLLDQRKAMEWVQKYIWAFGGNPNHVVLGGASAGAASISLHMTAYGGNDTRLFHAAAAESVSFATVLTVNESQYQYDNLAIQLGCAGSDSLSCIKSKTADEIQAVNTNIPYAGAASAPLYMWGPVLDGDMITDYPYDSYSEGKFIKIPLIVGDDTNEGTSFTPTGTSTLGQSDSFLKSQFPFLTLEQLGRINDLYPNTNDSCPNTGCYWRQVSDAYGDMRYMCPGIFVSSAMANYSTTGAYNYRYNVEDPAQVAAGYGVPHTVELNAIWGPENVGPRGSPPASYYPDGVNAAVIPVIRAYWISFIRTFDPNKYRYPDAARWEVWSPKSQDRLLFETGGNTTMESVDQTTRNRCEYFASIGVDIRQ
ncbi:Alpha/Beta hydrolase protein [Biscogniauxia marginata]|nr:Alpha/Beta hydrolase protein [Biscogniauxia marginata]